MKDKMNGSLRGKILRWCLLCTVFALVIETICVTYSSARIYSEQTAEQMNHSLQNMQSEIYTYLKSLETKLIATYNEKHLIRDLENGLETSILQEKYSKEAYALLSNNFENDDSVVALYLYSRDNELISSHRQSMTSTYHYPEDIYQEEYDCNSDIVSNYVESDDTAMLVSSYYNESRKTGILRLVLKLYKKSDVTRKAGYLVCDINCSNLEEIVSKYQNLKEMKIWLQPVGDRAVLSVGEISDFQESAYQNLTYEINQSKEEVENAATWGNYAFYQEKQTKYNLNVYVLTPQRFFSNSIRLLLQPILIILGVLFVLVFLLSIAISRSLTGPLEHLTGTINQIKEGNTSLRVEVEDRQDEINTLAQSFNEMLDQTQMLSEQKYQTQMLLERAEYQTLQAQINPHFLYNTLDTMSSIANIQNCTQVSNLSRSLANIFRYSLNMTDSLATVAEEIGHVRNYIYVMDVRNRSSIQYEFELERETYQYTLPRISIEPLVENALSHGLKNSRKEEKKVIIRTEQIGDCLIVKVIDNGVGEDAEQIMKRLKKEEHTLGERGKSIGLSNINNRLKKLYGRTCGITFESEPGVGTTVTIRVPAMQKEEAHTWLEEHSGF